MTPRVGLLVALAVLAACGGNDATSAVTEMASTARVSTTTSTIVADRSIPEEESTFLCSLERVLVDSSSVVRLSVDSSTPLDTWQPPSFDSYGGGLETRTTFDPVWVDPAADIARGSIVEIVAQRDGDPRGPAAPEVGTQTLVQRLRGSVLPQLWASGATVVALVGPWGVQDEPAWKVHVALTELPDGSIEFLGPCAAELSRSLAMVAAVRSAPADTSLLADLVRRALDPGSAADLSYVLHGWGFASLPTDMMAVPPLLFGNVSVTGVVYVPSGDVNGLLSMRSNNIGSGAAAAMAAAANHSP